MNAIIRIISFMCLCVYFYSCTSGTVNTHKYDNPAQCRLDSLITHYHKASEKEFNELALDEMFAQYNDELKSLFDASPIKDWQAQLQSLKSSDIMVDGTTYKRITFDLINGLECKPKITFNAVYYAKVDSLQSDSVYQKLKSIGNLEKVKFSGIIRKDENGSVLTTYESLGTSYLMTYPTFEITITDISQQ